MKAAIIGLGFMGRMHYRALQSLSGVDVIALCDKNIQTISQSEQKGGNIDGVAEKIDFQAHDLYADFDQLLAEEHLDAVFITLPTFLHKEYTVKALDAGLHVLCEKPMALTKEECTAMIEARDRSKKTLQIGHCIRFWPEYTKVKEFIDGGEYGRVISASFDRLGSAPNWNPDNWFADQSRSGGMPLDLHIHDTDFIQHLFGLPKSVRSQAAEMAPGIYGHMSTQFDYDGEMTVSSQGSWMATPSFGFEMSFKVFLEKAILIYSSKANLSLRVYPADGEAFTPVIADGDGYVKEIEHFIATAGTPENGSVITAEQARTSICIVAAEQESAQTHKVTIIKEEQ
ncbi:MAG: Gfo/Idh/MocA family oxidoreductase [Planctomycetes bacterium]|nr:Gfo/Idh/MocA family oxidoreductase [Planctomycetota bacterium]